MIFYCLSTVRRLPPGRDLGAVPPQRQRLLHHLRGGHGRRSGRRAAGLCTASLLSGFFFLGNASELIDPIYSILYFSFINCLWDGIMDPQVSSSFLQLYEFTSGWDHTKVSFQFFSWCALSTQMDKLHVYSASL